MLDDVRRERVPGHNNDHSNDSLDGDNLDGDSDAMMKAMAMMMMMMMMMIVTPLPAFLIVAQSLALSLGSLVLFSPSVSVNHGNHTDYLKQ